jgi:hypothetical protein
MRHVYKDRIQSARTKSDSDAPTTTSTFLPVDSAGSHQLVPEHEQFTGATGLRSSDLNVYSSIPERLQRLPADRFESSR